MEETEIWKSLDFMGYTDYMVSNWGRVKSIERIVLYNDGRKYNYPEKILKPNINIQRYGYLQIILFKNKKPKTFKVHRLVALAFLENPNNYPQVNHKDENKDNNNASNLEWVTAKQNTNYGTRNKRASKKMKGKYKGENHPMYGKHHLEETKEKISKANKGKHHSEEAKQKMRKPILQFTKNMVFIREWDSAKSVNIELNINDSSITKCCKNKLKSAYGFIWQYKE